MPERFFAGTRRAAVVGENLARFRRRRGLSQEDVCQLLEESFGVEVSRPTIARLETGMRNCSVDELLVLAALVDVPPCVLLEEPRACDEHEHGFARSETMRPKVPMRSEVLDESIVAENRPRDSR